MGFYDRPAQGKAKAETAAAVCDLVLTGVKHFKDMRLDIIRDAGTVIPDGHDRLIPGPAAFDADLRAGLCVFDGIVDEIDQNLHDQSCIHIHQKNAAGFTNRDRMLRRPPVHMPERFLNDVAHEFRGKVEIHLPVFDPGDGEQVFDKIDQPLGIVVDIGEDLLPRFIIELLIMGQQVAGIAGNGGQRRTDVMRDGAQEV